MKTIDNKFRSKVLKAAWKTYKKRSNWKFSTCLKKAWAWAKEVLLNEYRLWNPREGFFRIYKDEAYVQISVKERRPYGYYENHRAAKGESYFNGYYKLSGMTFEEAQEAVSRFNLVGMGGNLNLVASKF